MQVKNSNKGMTIIEVLISVCIIAIVLILLFSLLLQVRAEDRDNNIQSNFILNQSIMIKTVEEDIIDLGLKSISECSVSEILPEREKGYLFENENNSYCIQFVYGEDDITDSYGYLMLYKYKMKWKVEDGKEVFDNDADNNAPWMIRYQRGNYDFKKTELASISEFQGLKSKKNFNEKTSVMKELPGNIITDGHKPYVKLTNYSGIKNSGLLVLPIVTDMGEHYDIDISFTYASNLFSCHIKANDLENDFCINNNSNNGLSLTKKDYDLKVYLNDINKAVVIDTVTVNNPDSNDEIKTLLDNNLYLKTFMGSSLSFYDFQISGDSLYVKLANASGLLT